MRLVVVGGWVGGRFIVRVGDEGVKKKKKTYPVVSMQEDGLNLGFGIIAR
jgi:hypothetical protein